MKYGTFKNPANSVNRDTQGLSIADREKLAVKLREDLAEAKRLTAYLGRGGYNISGIENRIRANDKALQELKSSSKNPVKFWIVDTATDQIHLTITKGDRSKAESIADSLNRKAGKKRYDVVGFGVENPEIIKKGGHGKRTIYRVKLSEILAAYKKRISGDNYTTTERRQYLSYAKDDVGGWLGDQVIEILNLPKNARYEDLVITNDVDSEYMQRIARQRTRNGTAEASKNPVTSNYKYQVAYRQVDSTGGYWRTTKKKTYEDAKEYALSRANDYNVDRVQIEMPYQIALNRAFILSWIGRIILCCGCRY